MMARFVPMPVTADTPLNIVCAWDIFRQFHRKQFIQPFLKKLLAGQVDISLYIVRDRPGILHGKSFRNVSPSVHRTRSLISDRRKRSTPVALAVTAAHIFCFRINQCLVRQRAVQETLIIIRFPQSFSRLRNAIVIVGIFQCLGNRFGFFVKGDIPIPDIIGQAIIIFVLSCRLHRFVGPFVIEALHTFDNHICQHRDSVITDHAPGLITVKRPDRQHFFHTFVVMSQHGIGYIGIHILMHQIEPGVQGPVSVP